MMTIKPRIGINALLLPALLSFVSAASAQRAPEPSATNPQPGIAHNSADAPATNTVPNQSAPEFTSWDYERMQTNKAGTVSSAHRYLATEDGSQTYREHVVTTPRQEMLQSWERSVTDDGYTYRRQHIWTNPDGTPIRSHQWSTIGTDPNNYERSRTMVLRDGRTISKVDTRTWDGTQGTHERTMIGPNGQTRTFQHAWTPDGQEPDGATTNPPSMTGHIPSDPRGASSTKPLQRPHSDISAETQPKQDFWSKWNPLAKKPRTDISKKTPRTASTPPVRRGFTVGSHGRSVAPPRGSGVNKSIPGHSQGNARGRSAEPRRVQAMSKAAKTPPGHSRRPR